MGNEIKDTIKNLLIVAAIALVLPYVYQGITSLSFGYSTQDVGEKIQEHLYEKYGEEFVVSRIGTRSSRGDEFYQARIYPKSIAGTNMQGDDYYYASASVDKKSFGRLGGVGDSYSYVNRNIDVEEYLLPETKNIFGERLLLKVDVAHQITGDGSWWAGFKSKSLEEMREAVENDPEGNRIKLDLDVYIFDRIADEQEKEKRREDIFEYVQYLQEEGLFEHLELGVIFIDERVLADSYDEFEREVRFSNKAEEEIDGETVRMPPMDLREQISKELQEEVDKMNEEELLANMQEIRKGELNYDVIEKYNMSHFSEVYSPGMLKERYPTSLQQNPEMKRNFKNIDDINIPRGLRYMYIN